MGLKPTATAFVPIPAGTHNAVCVQIIDLGMQENKKFGTVSNKVMFAWELPDVKDRDGRARLIWQEFTNSMGQKASLRKVVESWLGIKMSAEQIKNYDPTKLLGRGCLVNVVHSDGADGNTYANVAAIMPLPKGTKASTPKSKPIIFDIDEWDQSVFDSFSERLQKKITEGRANRQNATSHSDDTGNDEPAQAAIPEEDIPF